MPSSGIRQLWIYRRLGVEQAFIMVCAKAPCFTSKTSSMVSAELSSCSGFVALGVALTLPVPAAARGGPSCLPLHPGSLSLMLLS